MKDIVFQYNDLGNTIWMTKRDWTKIVRWIRAHGGKITRAGGDGPITKYRMAKESKA